jgi:hypothetical protein
MKKLFTLVLTVFAVFALNAQITDSFEDYESFAVDPTGGFWTFYDGDGGSTYNFQDTQFQNEGYVGAAIVFEYADFAHTGNKCIIMFNAVPSTIVNGTTTNDWMISGDCSNYTTLSFFARAITAQYGSEIMRVLYSTTTNDPSAFQLIQQESVSTTEYTEYTYNLPAGTKYIAINCASNDVFGLMIDDVTISGGGGGVNINDVENTTFSVYPNPATTNITVKGEGSMEIMNTLGQVVVSEQVNGQANINVANLESGIYFVRMNGTTQKFIKK